MTMLMRWVFMAAVIFGPWMAIFTNRYQSPWLDQNRQMLLFYPFVLIAAFGVYSIVVIAWRVYNFNDCEEAALEIQKVTDPELYRRRADALLQEISLPSEAARAELFRRTRHDRQAWFEARRGRVTASVFKRIAGMRASTSCRSVVETLLYGAGRELDTPALRYGRRHEEKAISAYEREMGCTVQRPVGLVVHPQHGFVAATPDGIISNEHILEVKCPYRVADARLEALVQDGKDFFLDEEMKLKKNHAYFAQVQCQLACTGARMCDFFVWTPRETVCDRITFEPEFWNWRLERVREFYMQCVLPELVDPRKIRGLPFRERTCFTALQK
ncbi:uncharacterized protein LOC119089850 [Pollicipes pollicipes]|uniref:uncharacterized protein LOC119089850 n=1 Tax=Pollicipes pollicipes TaxID=41117 RepID=UPI001884C033|nr:uncharacterized protein LOC119089850 [Pollicipes pollicipes]